MRTRSTVLAASVLALLCAGPALGYTVYMKDGSSIQSKGKYRVQGNRAIIVLLNGTETFVELAKIDVAKTDKANQVDYGSAVVLEGVERTQPAPQPEQKKKGLADLIAKGAGPRELPVIKREDRGDGSPLGKTRAGFLDLAKVSRQPFASLEAAADLQKFFRAQGLEEVQIYQGTQGDRPLIEVTTNSEAAVFRALVGSANALIGIRETHAGVAALELLLTTPTRERAGQFLLTPEIAAELVAKKVEVTAFFIDHVQF